MIGDPTRARMLANLLDGSMMTATEVARAADVTPQTASVHLAKLVESGLVAVASAGPASLLPAGRRRRRARARGAGDRRRAEGQRPTGIARLVARRDASRCATHGPVTDTSPANSACGCTTALAGPRVLAETDGRWTIDDRGPGGSPTAASIDKPWPRLRADRVSLRRLVGAPRPLRRAARGRSPRPLPRRDAGSRASATRARSRSTHSCARRVPPPRSPTAPRGADSRRPSDAALSPYASRRSAKSPRRSRNPLRPTRATPRSSRFRPAVPRRRTGIVATIFSSTSGRIDLTMSVPM